MARHVSDLSGPSSGAFTSCMLRVWYVVFCVLLDTSGCYVGLHIYCKVIHGPYNTKLIKTVYRSQYNVFECSVV